MRIGVKRAERLRTTASIWRCEQNRHRSEYGQQAKGQGKGKGKGKGKAKGKNWTKRDKMK